ncbi:MAG: hypothetical protein AB7V48_10305 [Sedimentibacter sp.]
MERTDNPDGYWEWYRPDGTIKRLGYFNMGEPLVSGLPTIVREKSIKQPTGQKGSR